MIPKIGGLYGNGWLKSTIQSFRNGSYRVLFPDGADNYKKFSDADRVEGIMEVGKTYRICLSLKNVRT